MEKINGAPETQSNEPYSIFIDKVKYETGNSHRSGAELKEMAGLSKEFKIFVNTREKIWLQPTISFGQLMELAFGVYEDMPHIAYTSTYDKGPKENRNGVFVKGQRVYVTNNMIFNATRTDKS